MEYSNIEDIKIQKNYSYIKLLDNNEHIDSEKLWNYTINLEYKGIRLFASRGEKIDVFDHINPFSFLWKEDTFKSIINFLTKGDLWGYLEKIKFLVEEDSIQNIYDDLSKLRIHNLENPSLFILVQEKFKKTLFEDFSKPRIKEMISVMNSKSEFKFLVKYLIYILKIYDFENNQNVNITLDLLGKHKLYDFRKLNKKYFISIENESRRLYLQHKWNFMVLTQRKS